MQCTIFLFIWEKPCGRLIRFRNPGRYLVYGLSDPWSLWLELPFFAGEAGYEIKKIGLSGGPFILLWLHRWLGLFRSVDKPRQIGTPIYPPFRFFCLEG